MELDQVAAVCEAADLTSLGIPPDAPVITTVANIRPIKGIDIFIRTAALVRREFPQTHFLIAGAFNEPDWVAELQELARSLALENHVKFLGLRDDVLQLLRRSQVFCMLSRSEGFCNAVLEAMACELPCVVTRVGGNPEAIDDGVTGYLVPSEDYAAAADRISYLLRNPERAALIGRAAREAVRTRFSSERMMSDLTQFYESLVEMP
jgi:glycosyltransferase involved in cell wall biosynthesis